MKAPPLVMLSNPGSGGNWFRELFLAGPAGFDPDVTAIWPHDQLSAMPRRKPVVTNLLRKAYREAGLDV